MGPMGASNPADAVVMGSLYGAGRAGENGAGTKGEEDRAPRSGHALPYIPGYVEEIGKEGWVEWRGPEEAGFPGYTVLCLLVLGGRVEVEAVEGG